MDIDNTGVRRNIAQLLKETEERFHRMFDQMLEGCQIIGFDWRYLYANESVAVHSRTNRDWLMGRTMMECFPRFEGSPLQAAIAECMQDRVPRRLECRFDHTDGTFSWYDFSVQPAPEGIFMLSVDITERKLVEETLLESEERYRRVVETSNDGIWQVDSTLTTVFVNARMAEILGYTPEEMIGTSALRYFDESTLDFAKQRAERRRSGEQEEYVVQLRRKDGGDVWLLINSSPVFSKGQYIGALAMVCDVSERKRAEEKLRRSEERFQRLAESLPQLIWTCEPTGACNFLSRQWELYTGLSAQELIGSGWVQTVHPEDVTQLQETWDASLRSGHDFHCEFRIRRSDGKWRWFSSRGACQRDQEGQIISWSGASSDIEDEKRQRDSQARSQKMEALGTLAGGIAHDFNNILTAITGNALLALEDAPEGAAVRESLLEIERASRRATDLVRRILAFSRQEEPERKVIELKAVIEEALKLLRPTVPAQIELCKRYDENTPRTIGDATQVHQILMNLITNAAQAIGDRPGRIDIALEPSMVDGERATADLRPGRYLRLTVADNGCGMERETVERIFDPFFTTKPAGEGTGLGLSVVAGIMKSHGGAVNVYSEKDKGSVFRLYFPATLDAEQPVTPRKPTAAKARGQRVLYIDDDQFLVSLVKRKLTRLGYFVTCEQDPRNALALFLSDPSQFDVVVTDLSMPGLRGFDLAREMLAVRPDLPVIVASGYVRPEDQAAAREIGVRELVLKPNTSDDLGALLDQLFKEPESP